ncbi:MAG: restriction endonuclease subunit S [Bacteroidia bacterium]|nr:restriction endonuclease subunit S [Bacteroidia bacterium]
MEWIGEIPNDWKAERLASILNNVAERNRTDLPLLSITREKGVILRDLDNEEENHNFIPDDLSNYKVLRKGQFGMNKMKAWQGSYGISEQDGIVSPAYFIFQLRDDLVSRYFHLAIRSQLYISFFGSASDGVRIGQWDLSRDRMKNIPFLIPPLEEQNAIAAFLDRKTALIDQAIDIKQKQIELLKERRQILIHKAVTRGLNPNVKMKDSGVEWIGEIPEGWEVKRLKTLLQEGRDGIRIGPFGSSIKSEILKPEGYKIYGQEHVIADDFNIGAKYIDENDFKRLSNYELFAGDIVITMMGTTGKCKVVPNNIERGIMDSHLIRVRTKINNANPDFVSFLINDSKYIFNQIKLRSKGSIMEGLNSSIVKSLHLLLPPLNEQKSILLNIDETNSKFKTAISLKEQEIEKLKEYKATLINSAVTGKIKVS